MIQNVRYSFFLKIPPQVLLFNELPAISSKPPGVIAKFMFRPDWVKSLLLH